MYKTVRHGENSLQYTILPQDGDEESGKAGGSGGGKSGGKGGGPRGPGNNNGGGRGCCRPRTALFLVLTALLIGVVTASVAVPLLLTTDLLSLPGAAFPFAEHRPQMQVRPHQYQHHPAYNASAFRRRLTPPNPPASPTALPTTTQPAAAEVTTAPSPTANPESPTTPLPSTEKPASGVPGAGREQEEMPAAPGPPDGTRGGGGGVDRDVHSTTASVPAPSKVKGLDDDDDDDDLEDDDDDDDEEESIPPVPVQIDERPDDEDEDEDEGEGPSADGPAGVHTASTEAVRGDAAGYLAAPANPSPPGGNASRPNTIWVTPPRNSTRNDGGYLLSQQQQYGIGGGSTPEVSGADPGEASTDLGDSVIPTTTVSPMTTTTTASGAAAVPQMPQATATTPPRTSTFPASPTDEADVKFGNNKDAWQGSRWLFTDPSSYLQWTGYNRDGLLLPVILGTVVILVPATIAVCFMIIRRRRRQKDLRRETIGKIASDLQYGDKATLLADASEEE
ncbi:proline-, glutamic acid- and leucine-rich protein 1 [Ischnura elegans]|uniref:proline-, glutamic acid- and leucine-rich protein 1 n=1 Tax=Ischnura elegans TaxID=197161 RepID=UPI001ED866D5|nr:proline-, glutamic acid- and leucine-rich protein 1 [Ischnura elegans]